MKQNGSNSIWLIARVGGKRKCVHVNWRQLSGYRKLSSYLGFDFYCNSEPSNVM